MSRQRDRGTGRIPLAAIISRLTTFAVLWWALTEGDTYNLWFGAAIVVLATGASLVLLPVTRMRPWHLLTLTPFFIRESVSGGVDVARRAFAPDMPVDPAIVEIPVRLPEGPSRVFLATLLNLTPGTVSVELLPGSLRIHLLNQVTPIEERIREIEKHAARLFGIDLDRLPEL